MTPKPEQIIAARTAAKLTQTAAAELVSVTLRAWQYWEAGDREMSAAMWELFQIKAGLQASPKTKARKGK
jgi:putative transcriptional regulator